MVFNSITIFWRVLKQLYKDKQLIAMIFIGPIVTLTLLFIAFKEDHRPLEIGVVLAKNQTLEQLNFLQKNFIFKEFSSTKQALEALNKDELLGALDFTSNTHKKATILLEGTRPLKSQKIIYTLFADFLEYEKQILEKDINKKLNRLRQKIPIDDLKIIQKALIESDKKVIEEMVEKIKNLDVNIKIPKISTKDFPTVPSLFFDIQYLFGGVELDYFNSISPVLVSFFIFFIIFLIGGIAFLRERNTRTLSRTFAAPVKEREFILGYFLSFSIIILMQVGVLQYYTVKFLDIINNGSLFYVFLLNLSVSLTGLVLGFIFSTLSKTEFQLVQLIPIVVIPQLIFSGIFDTSFLPASINWIGAILPLHYVTTALIDVAIRGRGLEYVLPALYKMSLFLFVLMSINAFLLRRIRKREG